MLCAAALLAAPPLSHSADPAAPAGAAKGCLPTGNGYLRARIRGAMNLDVNWHNAELQCEGGPRPDGSGLRVAFAGPAHADGRRLRLVFGVDAVHEGRAGHDLPTNLTVIFEGEDRLFATRGDDHCTVDELRQERVGALGGAGAHLADRGARLLHRPGQHAQQRRTHPGEQLRLCRHGGV